VKVPSVELVVEGSAEGNTNEVAYKANVCDVHGRGGNQESFLGRFEGVDIAYIFVGKKEPRRKSKTEEEQTKSFVQKYFLKEDDGCN